MIGKSVVIYVGILIMIFQLQFSLVAPKTEDDEEAPKTEDEEEGSIDIKCYLTDLVDCFPTNSSWWYFLSRPRNIPILKRSQIGTTFKLFKNKNDFMKDEEGAMIYADKMDTLAIISPSRPVKFLIHGFQGSSKTHWLKDMMEGLLMKGDNQIIVVDWERGATESGSSYLQAVVNTRAVGLEISIVVNQLITHYNMSSKNFHLIGHSLGAHVAGYAGERIHKLGQITGLDPAGPAFHHMPTFVRLDRSDAEFVDVYHTDGMTGQYGFGIMEPIGHVDFYINGGGLGSQPVCNCKWFTFFSEACFGCSHNEAPKIYSDSLRPNKCQLVGYQCPAGYSDFIDGLCNECGLGLTKCAIVGPSAILNPTRGENSLQVYVKTNLKSPYCLYHYHVTLNLVKPEEAYSYVHGKLSIQLIGDDGTLSTDWPDQKENWADYFYQDKNEKKLIFLSEKYIGKIREVKLKWVYVTEFLKPSSWQWCVWCHYDLFLSSVDIQVMNDPSLFSSNNGNLNSFMVCIPNEEPQYATLKSGGSSFSFWETC